LTNKSELIKAERRLAGYRRPVDIDREEAENMSDELLQRKVEALMKALAIVEFCEAGGDIFDFDETLERENLE
jgi:hypothetical protein